MTYQDFFSKYTYDRRTDMLMQGRFGAIYKATYSRRKAEVLLRIMKLDDGSDSVSLKEETEFVEALPHCPYIVRYPHSYRFQESTGEVDCAVMPFFPLGNLVKVFEDWKLDAAERRGLRDRILDAAAFLRGNEVNLPPFDPATIFVSEENGELIPHLIDISGVMTDNPDYEAQVAEFITVPEEEPETPVVPQVTVTEHPIAIAEPEPIPEPEPEPEVKPVEETEEGSEIEEEQPDNNGLKWKLIGGVVLTWAAIIALIWAMHVKRNSVSQNEDAAEADKVEKVTYPADEYARQEAARLDSIEKAKADSIAAYKADSAAYMQKIEAEKKLKAEEAKKKKEAEAKKAAETEETVHQQEQPEAPTAPTTPVEKPTPSEPQPEAI